MHVHIYRSFYLSFLSLSSQLIVFKLRLNLRWLLRGFKFTCIFSSFILFCSIIWIALNMRLHFKLYVSNTDSLYTFFFLVLFYNFFLVENYIPDNYTSKWRQICILKFITFHCITISLNLCVHKLDSQTPSDLYNLQAFHSTFQMESCSKW